MKTLLGLALLGDISALAGLATASPAAAKPVCHRVLTPNSPVYLAITTCRGVKLPPFFQAIGWQRIENLNIPGSTNTVDGGSSSPGGRSHSCHTDS